MIRINLLAGERRSEKPARTFQPGQKMTAAGILLLLVTALLLGWRYWALTETDARLQREIESAQREETRLTEILKQVQDFERRKAQYLQRVALIDELQRSQVAPVHMIDQVSRAVPEMMWLTNIKQVGYDVTIEGRCLSLTALSDFVGNLGASHYFQKPVEILDSKVEAGAENAPDIISFTVKATFQMAGIEAKPPDAPKTAKKGGQRG